LDETIYGRIVIEMALVQQEYAMRDIQGVIFFRQPTHDPNTSPWNRVVTSVNLPDSIQRLDDLQLAHPLVSVFKPILEADTDRLERRTVNYS